MRYEISESDPNHDRLEAIYLKLRGANLWQELMDEAVERLPEGMMPNGKHYWRSNAPEVIFNAARLFIGEQANPDDALEYEPPLMAAMISAQIPTATFHFKVLHDRRRINFGDGDDDDTPGSSRIR